MFRRSFAFLFFASAALSASPALAKPYKGAEIYTQQDYQYGKIEMRMQMARGSGVLSTFFLYKDGSEQAATFWEEVDIEVFGKNNATTWQSNIITGLDPRTLSEGVHDFGASLADAYHTYTLEWRPGSVRWLLDGTEVRNTMGGQANDLTNGESIRFNIWAAFAEGWVGPFDDAVLPQYQYVSWVKYYRLEGDDFVLDWTDDFNTFDTGRWGKANWTFAENRVDFAPENAVVQDGILVLALTREGETGFTGTPPADDGTGTGGTDAGTGGAVGAGGGTGTGGLLGTGGAVGGASPTDDNPATGGLADPNDPNAAPGEDGDNVSDDSDPGDDAGCSCRTAPVASRTSSLWGLGLLGLGLVFGRARRRDTARG